MSRAPHYSNPRPKVYGASVSPAEVILVSEFVEGGVLRGVLDNPLKLKHLTQRYMNAVYGVRVT